MDKVFLLYGADGWIGQQLYTLLRRRRYLVIKGRSRLENYASLRNEIREINPNFVLNAAGITGKPNVDWCEDHPQDTMMVNTIGAINLADICWRQGILLTFYTTGCIYNYDQKHPYGVGFKEEENPNYALNIYAQSKIMAEMMLVNYDNVLILRMRLPVIDESHPKNILTKLPNFKKIISIPNSFSYLPELLPISIELTLNYRIGTYNLVNPGVITHQEILELYKKYLDPTVNIEVITVEEQNSTLKAPRCNCQLDCSKLLGENFTVTPIHEVIEKIFLKKSLKV